MASSSATPSNDAEIGTQWFRSFSDAIDSGDVQRVVSHILEDGYWRDLFVFTWDHRTLHSTANISTFLSESDQLRKAGLTKLSLDGVPERAKANESFTWIQCFFNFESKVATGRGFFRLMEDANDKTWKAKTIYTVVEELKGYPEKSGKRRPEGVNHGQHAGRKSWLDQRADEVEFKDSDPQVLVIGAGQAGLSIGARLKQLSVPTLLIDTNDRVGDNWRKRYNFLVLHDPVWYDHLPYVPFPEQWPIFTPKDKLGDWFEAYAKTMELNIWMQSTLVSSSYDQASHTWTAEVSRGNGGQMRTLKPKFIVVATGHSGEPNIPTFKDQDLFAGKIVHSSQHTTGGEAKGKKAVVIGCCNSGHDIAQDFYEQGADVTIVQRSGTYVMTADSGAELFGGLDYEGGPPTEIADTILHSIPSLMFKDLHGPLTARIAALDKDILEGLKNVGFKVDFGENGTGLMTKYYTKGGGYYIDVGCSQLIIDQKIKLKQGHEISHFTKNEVVFDDGTAIEADTVVLATGYKNMKTMVVKILGEEAECLSPVWNMDQEGELVMWRFSGHPGIYTHGGNLAHCRYWSKRLALLIKAQLEGIAPM